MTTGSTTRAAGSVHDRLARARLYLCTDARRERGDLDEFVARAVTGGVDIVQLRDKGSAGEERFGALEAAEELAILARLRDITHAGGALLSVNDRADLAKLSGADVLHVGQGDLTPAQARGIVGEDVIIGQSTHDAAQAAAAAADRDVDYFCVGPCWPTPTKPGRTAPGLGLVREVAASSCIDLRRVYATGLSRGGAFSAYLGCQSTMFAALAPVAGANLVRPCAGPPVSVLAIHGTADPYVDYDGLDPEVAAVDDTFYNAPALDNAAAWAQRDGCTGQQEVAEAADVTRTTWLECADGTSVQLLTITGGGHVWPGAAPRDVAQFGATTTSISGNDVILDFFDAHHR